jgi:DNA repair exonuclease SbcCD nuclease subunit
MRFLHTADLHLGKSLKGLPPDKAKQRREDLKQVLRNIVAAIKQHEADALLIAGDLFDQPKPPAALADFVAHVLCEAEIPVVITPGNHDPLVDDSPYLSDRFSSNVHIVRSLQWERLPLNLPLSIYAIAYDLNQPQRNVIAELREAIGSDSPSLAIVHASCDDAEFDHERYFPFRTEDLAGLPISYLALGHWHRRWQHGVAYYPASPEPLTESEGNREHGVFVVTVDDDTGQIVQVEYIPVGVRRYKSMTLNVEHFDSEAAIVEHLRAQADRDCLLSLTVQGLPHFDWTKSEGDLEDELQDCFFAVTARVAVAVPDISAQPNTVKDEFIKRLRAEWDSAKTDGERELLTWALRYGVLALDGRLP